MKAETKENDEDYFTIRLGKTFVYGMVTGFCLVEIFNYILEIHGS